MKIFFRKESPFSGKAVALFVALFSFSLAHSAEALQYPQTYFGSPGWQLVWSDEFTGNGPLDSTKWTIEVGGDGWWNNEDQFYTDRLKNVRRENDHLVIETHKEDYEHRHYTSGRIQTWHKADFLYGKIEARIRIPGARGSWPAFWMLASDNVYSIPDAHAVNGEIDIMENVGFDPERVHHYIHTHVYNHWSGTAKGFSDPVPGATQEFHVYTLEWWPDRLDFFVDGVHRWQFLRHGGWQEWPFDQKFFLILNNAIGGWGGQQGIDDGAFPHRLEVDYVRVYAPAL